MLHSASLLIYSAKNVQEARSVLLIKLTNIVARYGGIFNKDIVCSLAINTAAHYHYSMPSHVTNRFSRASWKGYLFETYVLTAKSLLVVGVAKGI